MNGGSIGALQAARMCDMSGCFLADDAMENIDLRDQPDEGISPVDTFNSLIWTAADATVKATVKTIEVCSIFFKFSENLQFLFEGVICRSNDSLEVGVVVEVAKEAAALCTSCLKEAVSVLAPVVAPQNPPREKNCLEDRFSGEITDFDDLVVWDKVENVVFDSPSERDDESSLDELTFTKEVWDEYQN